MSTPIYAQKYNRFVESFEATDAELSDCRLVAYDATEPTKVAYATAAGEILGSSLMFLHAKSADFPYSANRMIPVVNSGLILVDSDGSLAIGDVVTAGAEGIATNAGAAVTLNGKDLIVREVVSTGDRDQVRVAV